MTSRVLGSIVVVALIVGAVVVPVLAVGLSTPVGDMNCNGTVGFEDINPFVLVLTGGEGQYLHDLCLEWGDEGGYWCFKKEQADADCSGEVDFADIDAFIDILMGGEPCDRPMVIVWYRSEEGKSLTGEVDGGRMEAAVEKTDTEKRR